MKRILIKRILPLLCVGLLLCTPHTIAYAAADGMAEESTEPMDYSVEIAWESLEFDYASLWNPDEHCYDGWKSTETSITVTNMSENGAPIWVTLTFVSTEKMGTAAVFSSCGDDLNSDEFTFSDGQVTFRLPRDADGETQATVNLSLTGDPVGWEIEQYMGWEIEQYNQIGTIKTEITPLHDGTEYLEGAGRPPGVSEVQKPPATDLPLPETAPPVVEEPTEKQTPPEPGAPPQEEP